MKTTIRVSCVDQVLKIVDRPLLASGGLNEAVVAFDFCEKWNGYAKTGVFYRDEDEVYYSILDDDDICVIPWEVYSTPGYFYFTVFGDKGDVRRTTNTVKYKAQKGLAGSDMLPSDPSPEVYDQIMGRLSEIEQGAGGGGNSGTGENGGYYTPKVSQPNENTMRVSFTASKAGMPSVAAQNITLPAGKDYVLTEADKQEIADMVEVPEGGSGSNIDADWIATKELAGGDELYIPEQTVSSGLWNNLQMSLQPGFEYDVTLNGEVYTCEARADGQGVAIGNNTSMSLNDYPFCISWAGGSAISGMFFKRSDISYPITLKVTDHAYYVYDKLPEGYLPDSVVKSVNGKTPDENGNVEVEIPEGGTVTDEQIASAVKDYFEEHPVTLNIRDVLDGEVFVLDADNTSGDDTGGSGGDSGGNGDNGETGGDNTGTVDIDIPSENLVAYYDMRTPLTADNLITDLSGNEKHIQFYPNNGYYENGKMYRGDKYTAQWGNVTPTYNITGGAKNINYGSAVTVLATIKNPLTNASGTTPVCQLGDSNAVTSLVVFKKNLMVYQSAGWNKPGNKTPITANAIQTVAFSAVVGGNENVYIDGVVKNTNAATNLNLGSSFYPLTGYGSSGDTGQEIYNIAVYNRELTASEIATISATLLANAGGAT